MSAYKWQPLSPLLPSSPISSCGLTAYQQARVAVTMERFISSLLDTLHTEVIGVLERSLSPQPPMFRSVELHDLGLLKGSDAHPAHRGCVRERAHPDIRQPGAARGKSSDITFSPRGLAFAHATAVKGFIRETKRMINVRHARDKYSKHYVGQVIRSRTTA